MPLLATLPVNVAGVPGLRVRASVNGFPSFLPKAVEKLTDPSARDMASRIERLPVEVEKYPAALHTLQSF